MTMAKPDMRKLETQNNGCAYELDRWLKVSGVITKGRLIAVNVFDTGLMPGTGLARDYITWQQTAWKFMVPLLRLVLSSMKSLNRHLML